uniref:Carboxylic ester hydrolase n=1 Tax=Plectus sambesii TaxID=2011161 RepID=A0A914URG4_9BILA
MRHLWSFALIAAVHCTTLPEQVKLRNGLIKGVKQSHAGRQVTAFLGVPFAESPLGSNRFSPPIPVADWNGVFSASQPARACYQSPSKMYDGFEGEEMWNDYNFGEDCLYLNFWVPEQHDGTVMVWIFGGGFTTGSPSLDLYDGRVLAATQGVIVVNLNYRVGPFGFAYLGDDTTITGNAGLLDQQLGLKWISENIGAFGGDSNKVTLFGESAGAVSATSHLLAEDSVNLFQRVIAQSGSVFNPWGPCSDSVILNNTRRLAARVGCSLSDPKSSFFYSPDASFGDFGFAPIPKDKHFFKTDLFHSIATESYKKNVDIMVGATQDEATYFLSYIYPHLGMTFNQTQNADSKDNKMAISNEAFLNIVHNALSRFEPFKSNRQKLDEVIKRYVNLNMTLKLKKSVLLRNAAANIIDDFFFTCDLIAMADRMNRNINGKVYLYNFQQRSSWNPWPDWMGAMHGYEIEYHFGYPLRRSNKYNWLLVEEEKVFANQMMQFWASFAKTGIPTADGLTWPEYQLNTKQAMILRAMGMKTVTDLDGEKCAYIHNEIGLDGFRSCQ